MSKKEKEVKEAKSVQSAAFSLENYRIEKVVMDLSNNDKSGLSIKFDVSGEFIKSDYKYELYISIDAFNKGKEKSPFVKIECVATFDFDNIENFEDIPSFFYRNSIAIVFPYLRAYTSIITTQANVQGVILPTLNLSSLESKLIERTTQK